MDSRVTAIGASVLLAVTKSQISAFQKARGEFQATKLFMVIQQTHYQGEIWNEFRVQHGTLYASLPPCPRKITELLFRRSHRSNVYRLIWPALQE